MAANKKTVKKGIDLDVFTKDLFVMIPENDILREVAFGKLTYRGKVLSHEAKNGIIHEADILANSELLKILFDEMKYLAGKKLYFDCQNDDDIRAGKAMLWAASKLQEKIIRLQSIK